MSITIDGGAGITFPDTVQQTNGMTMTGGNPKYYAARAWVNFDGTGTVSIRAAVNVSSITDSGTGNYRVNFTTAMTDNRYAISGSLAGDSDTAAGILIMFIADPADVLTSSVRVRTSTENGNAFDTEYASLIVFR
jgi:hypothetical protein